MSSSQSSQHLRYYTDSSLQTPLPSRLTWKVVRQGTVARKDFVIKNIHNQVIDLEPITDDPDIHFSEYPLSLLPGQVGKVAIEFRPPMERPSALSAGWRFNIIVRPTPT